MAVSDVSAALFGFGGASNKFYSKILTDHYADAVVDAIINPNTLLGILPRDKTRVQGKNVVFPAHTGRNWGGNAIADGGALPDPQTQDYEQFSFAVKGVYHRVIFSKVMQHASESDVASWLRQVDTEMKGASSDMRRRLQRIFHNDGSGRLAQVASQSGTAITLKIHDGIEGSTAKSTTAFEPGKFIKEGINSTAARAQRLTFCDSNGTQGTADTTYGTAYADSTNILTVAANPGIVADDWVVETSVSSPTVATDTGYKNEPMGLAGIYSDADPATGNFQGIASSSNEFNRAIVLDNSAVLRPLTEELMQKAYAKGIEEAEANFDYLLSSFGIVRTYMALRMGDIRFVNSTDIKGGVSSVTFNGLPFVADRDMWSNEIKFIDSSNLRIYELAEPQWEQEDGNILVRVANKHAFEAMLYTWNTLGCDWRKKCLLLNDLTELS